MTNRTELLIEEGRKAHQILNITEINKILNILKKSKSLSYKDININELNQTLKKNKKIYFLKDFPTKKIFLDPNKINQKIVLNMLNFLFEQFNFKKINNLKEFEPTKELNEFNSQFLGLIPPVIIFKNSNNDIYNIIDGNNRIALSIFMLKNRTIPAFIIE